MVAIEELETLLKDDIKVRVAGVDPDGVLRGKVMAKEKFLGSIKSGFGFSSAIFGWDMHDALYTTKTIIAGSEEGYADFIAHPDLSSFRRLPFEDDIPFFLLTFTSDGQPVHACARSSIKALTQRLKDGGFTAWAGGK